MKIRLRELIEVSMMKRQSSLPKGINSIELNNLRKKGAGVLKAIRKSPFPKLANIVRNNSKILDKSEKIVDNITDKYYQRGL